MLEWQTHLFHVEFLSIPLTLQKPKASVADGLPLLHRTGSDSDRAVTMLEELHKSKNYVILPFPI